MKQWYLDQKPAVRLIITFLLNCVLWLGIDLFTHWLIPDDEPRKLRAYVFKAVFMGLVWTLLFNMPLVKTVFRHKKQQDVN